MERSLLWRREAAPVIAALALLTAIGYILLLTLGAGDSASYLRREGVKAMEQGDLHTARANLEEAAALRPENPSYLADLAHIYALLERHAGAISYYSKALELDPEHTESLVGRAKALADIGAVAEAERDLDAARRLGVIPAD